MTLAIKRLRDVAKSIRRTDQCGAQLIQWAARLIDKDKCANCQNAYSRGYAVGYKKYIESGQRQRKGKRA